MRALVTGDAGFVGRHLRCAIESRGWDVVGADLRSRVDALNLFRFDDTRFDLAIHCAAIVGGRASIDGSPLGVATNLALDSWFMHWLQRTGTRRAVYFSSSAAYPVAMQGRGVERRLVEDDINLDLPRLPDSTYGWAKLTGEQLAQRVEVCRILIPRPFSGYGSDQALDYPFPSFIRRAVEHERPFRIWGDGGSARDWVHIDDVVGAVLAAVDQDVAGPVNICTGRATTFDELAATCMTAAGWQPSAQLVEYVTDAPQGVFWRVGDPTKLHEFYRPRVTLEEGIARAVEAAS